MSAPDLARFSYCPQCAQQTLSARGNTGIHCSACDYIYFHSPIAAAVAIIECEDRIVITKRALDPHQGLWALPGGFVDYEESLEETLAREMKEELGIDVVAPIYLASYGGTYLYKDVHYFTTVAYFIVRVDDLANAVANDDIDEFHLAHPDETDRYPMAFDIDRQAWLTYRQLRGVNES